MCGDQNSRHSQVVSQQLGGGGEMTVPLGIHGIKCKSSLKNSLTGEKRGVAGLLLGRTEPAARAAELQLCAQAR